MAAEAAAQPATPSLPAVFDAAMTRLGPFEARPVLAVAVSGGPDSMALALLAHGWAEARGGTVHGLIVDHGLRSASAEEARRAAAWLEAAGIAATVMRWDGAKPATGIQEAARAARYERLEGWCRAHGVLHLLLGHHRDDQEETMAHRAARGSGALGLAGMSAVVEGPAMRHLRPLLEVGKSRLLTWLAARGQGWIDDPSNRDPGFARARLRRDGIAALPPGDPGGGRIALELEAARLLAAMVRLDDAGYAVADPATLREAPERVARTALAAVLRTVGGAPYPPRSARLDALLAAIRGDALGGGRTLAGCRVAHGRAGLTITREARAVEAPRALDPDEHVMWDGRYRARGPEGWRIHGLGQMRPERAAAARIPGPARAALPALSDHRGLTAVPHLGWYRGDVDPAAMALALAPRWALAGAPFVAGV